MAYGGWIKVTGSWWVREEEVDAVYLVNDKFAEIHMTGGSRFQVSRKEAEKAFPFLEGKEEQPKLVPFHRRMCLECKGSWPITKWGVLKNMGKIERWICPSCHEPTNSEVLTTAE